MMSRTEDRTRTRRRVAIATLLAGALLAVYFAIPFALLSPLADCHPPAWAQSVIRYGYPSLHMSSDSAYRRYWLKRFNVQVRRTDPICLDRNTRIDAS